MAKIRFMLNTKKLQNYAFFDSQSGLHVTMRKTIDAIEEHLFNPNLFNALKNNTIIDLDGNVDMETGKLADAVEPKKEESKEEPVVETKEEVKEEEQEEKKTTGRRSTKAKEE